MKFSHSICIEWAPKWNETLKPNKPLILQFILIIQAKRKWPNTICHSLFLRVARNQLKYFVFVHNCVGTRASESEWERKGDEETGETILFAVNVYFCLKLQCEYDAVAVNENHDKNFVFIVQENILLHFLMFLS